MAFRQAGSERVNAFEVDGRYLFKHYFEGDDLFSRLEQYYDEYEYRFEVPTDRLGGIRALLDDHGYTLVTVDDVDPFAVVKRKYTERPTILFTGSVYHRSVDRFNCFVMTDRDTVERAVSAGGTPLADTGLGDPL